MNLFTTIMEGEGPDAIKKKKEFWSFPAFLSRKEGDPRVHMDDKFLIQTEDDKKTCKIYKAFCGS